MKVNHTPGMLPVHSQAYFIYYKKGASPSQSTIKEPWGAQEKPSKLLPARKTNVHSGIRRKS